MVFLTCYLAFVGSFGCSQLFYDTLYVLHRVSFFGDGALYSLAVAPDGMTAAVGGPDGRIVVWDLDG